MVIKSQLFFLFLVSIFLFCISFFKYSENFYSSAESNSSKTTIDDLLSGKLLMITDMLKEIKSNKYNLDVTEAITGLDRDITNTTNPTTNLFIRNKKIELSNIQKNLNVINETVLMFSTNTMVKQYVNISDETSIQKIPIIEAVSRLNDALLKISKQLSEIPE